MFCLSTSKEDQMKHGNQCQIFNLSEFNWIKTVNTQMSYTCNKQYWYNTIVGANFVNKIGFAMSHNENFALGGPQSWLKTVIWY